MNMLLHGLGDARIEKGDVIRDPKLVADHGVMVFDRVIANPPFSLDEWGREVAEHDPRGRFGYGVPSKTNGGGGREGGDAGLRGSQGEAA